MSAQKPVYSRPSDDEPAPAPKKRKRHHKRKNAALTGVNESFTPHEDDGVTKRDPITEAKGIAKRDHLQDDGDAVVKRHPTTTGTHHTRNRRTHQRAKRRARELRAENERLHRRLAAIYDALTLD
ncbi:hypothetical protein [Bifidobacterium pseudolongum]|uniref:hypothetical protein n=1 Tax=Bifidobacterium pseudolongum TaxID=1694 RepID=UPI00101F5DC5|nr:hypothetical protein [Bifidobacterium pseudolongum]RYQ75694.1 hypothetical protein PG2012B_0175 [Bifidobacterium pseudolongum subsp. globosum]